MFTLKHCRHLTLAFYYLAAVNMVAKLTRSKILEQFHDAHGSKYDYSKFEYINGHYRSVIICRIHGEFLQSAVCHKNRKQGCPQCGNDLISSKQRLSLFEVIKRFKEVHGKKYDYSKVNYVKNNIRVCITCPEHGDFWQQPNNHFQGKGCQKCARILNTWSRSSYIEICKKRNKGQCSLYVLVCQEPDGLVFYKIGITYQKIKYRFKASYIPYDYRVKYLFQDEAGFIYDMEKRIHKLLSKHKYVPQEKFHGSAMECFSKIPKEIIKLLDELSRTDQLQLIA